MFCVSRRYLLEATVSQLVLSQQNKGVLFKLSTLQFHGFQWANVIRVFDGPTEINGT